MDWSTFATNDFALTVPADWSRRALLSFLGPQHDGVPRSIVLTQDALEDERSLSAYAREQLKQLEARLPSFRLQDEQSLSIGEQPAHQFVFNWKPDAASMLTQLQVFILWRRTAWTITGTAARAAQDDFRALFEHVVLSFVNRLSTERD